MTRNSWFATVGLFVIAMVALGQIAKAKTSSTGNGNASNAAASGPAAAFFDALDAGQVDAKLIVMNDHAARLILTNHTKQPLNLKLPDAFAGVPVAAQFGGGGGARGGGARGGGARGGGGQQQSVGGGLGGGGGGGLGGGGGGGGGFFSVPAEKTEKLDFAVLCMNHGLREPSSSSAYTIVPADVAFDRPAAIELLKAFGRGELKHAGAQAAAWNLNNDLSWNQLAAKLQGTRRSFSRPPYFTADEIRAGMAYASDATRLADANADEYQRKKKERAEKEKQKAEKKKAEAEKAPKTESSDALSTNDTESNEPAKAKSVDKSPDAEKATDKDKD